MSELNGYSDKKKKTINLNFELPVPQLAKMEFTSARTDGSLKTAKTKVDQS